MDTSLIPVRKALLNPAWMVALVITSSTSSFPPGSVTFLVGHVAPTIAEPRGIELSVADQGNFSSANAHSESQIAI